jgi:hypothetical protein
MTTTKMSRMVFFALAVTAAILLLVPPVQGRGRGGGGRGSVSRGSVSSANRSGSGGSWSGAYGSGTTSRQASANRSQRTTTYQGRGGQTATGTRSATRSGDTVTVDRSAGSSTGASRQSQKQYEFDDGRLDSVERQGTATDRYGRSGKWEGEAERSGAGWKFEGEGTNRYGRDTEVEGYGARGRYGGGVVADVEGGRYGDRTVSAWKPYGGPTYVSSLPYGARPYNRYGRSYYYSGGYYYRPYHGGYYHVPPPYGYCCYEDDDLLGAIALTVVGVSLLYSDGVYYGTTYVEGSKQYEVVPAPAGASLPQGSVPAEAATVTVGGVTYYYHANTFYKAAPVGGTMGFVVVTRPKGVKAVSALPADVEPLQRGGQTYFVSGGTHYMIYLSPAGTEEYIVVDPPPGEGTAAGTTKSVPLTLPAGTSLTVRLTKEVNSGKNRMGDSFSAYLDHDLLVSGVHVAGKGAMAHGRVAEAAAGASGTTSKIVLELTDIQAGGRVVSIATDRVQAAGEKPKAGRKVLGGAALGAGIGHIIDDDHGAAVGAAVGTAGGMAAAAKTKGGEVAFAAGTALTFRTSQTTIFNKSVNVASGP